MCRAKTLFLSVVLIAVTLSLNAFARSVPADRDLTGFYDNAARRAARVDALIQSVAQGDLSVEAAALALTGAERALLSQRVPHRAAALKEAVAAQGAGHNLLRDVAAGRLSPLDAWLRKPVWPYDEALRAFDKRHARTISPTGVQYAMLAAAAAGGKRFVYGALDAQRGAVLLAMAWPTPNVGADLALVYPMSAGGRARLRTALLSRRHLSETRLAEALSIALTVGEAYQRPRVAGVLAPSASKQSLVYRVIMQRPGMLERLFSALAARRYPNRLPWNSVYRTTVRSLAIAILADGTPSQRRAVARFATERAKALGVLDHPAMEIARLASKSERNLAMMIRPVYDLWRHDNALAKPMMRLLGLAEPPLDDSGPFELSERVSSVEEAMCGVETAAGTSAAPATPTDDKAARLREIVMRGTQAQLDALARHTGPKSRGLAYRECEVLLRRYDVTAADGETARSGALGLALSCLERHTAAYKSHGAAALELARVYDDLGRNKDAVAALIGLLDAPEERTRVLAGYRLMGKALSGGVASLGLDAGRMQPLARAARTIAAEGQTPHQQVIAQVVLAWIDSIEGKPAVGFERMATLLDNVMDRRSGKAAFADLGSLVDYTNKLAVLGAVDVGRVLKVYRELPKRARVTGLIQLARFYARRGQRDELTAVAASVRKTTRDLRAELLLTLAELDEVAPQGGDSDGKPMFDGVSAAEAQQAFKRLAVLSRKGNKAVRASAACAAQTYVMHAAEALIDSGRLDDAAAVLRSVMDGLKVEQRTDVALLLADVEDRRGEYAASAALYHNVLTAEGAADKLKLHLIDYYQVAVRAKSKTHRQTAATLIADRATPLLREAATRFANDADSRRQVFVIVHDLLLAEGRWHALLATSELYTELGASDLAATACTGAHHGLFVREVAGAGFSDHFKARGDGAAAVATCSAAIVAAHEPDSHRHLTEASDLAEAALSCGGDAAMAVAFAVDGAEAARLMSDLPKAEKLLDEAQRLHGLHPSLSAQREVLGWAALLADDNTSAERLLAAAGTSQAAAWAGFVALADKRFDTAATHFEAAAVADGDPGHLARLWLARARLLSGDSSGYLKALGRIVSRIRKPGANLALELSHELYTATRNPALARSASKLLEKLARRTSKAVPYRAVVRAQKYLDKTVLKSASARFKTRRSTMRRYNRLTGTQFGKLATLLAPAMKPPRGDDKVVMGAIVPAAELMMRGLYAVRVFLEAHESISDDPEWSDQIVVQLDELGFQVASMADATLGTANKMAYSDAALKRYARFLVEHYPELFEETRKWAFLCEDELPAAKVDGSEDAATTAAWSQLAQARVAQARIITAECVDPEGFDNQALRFETTRGSDGMTPDTVPAAAAAELARRIDMGVNADPTVMHSLAGHYAGVDCARTTALLEASGEAAPVSLQMASAACRGDRDALTAVLKKQVATDPDARTLRRLADLQLLAAADDADVKAVEALLTQSAAMSGMETAQARSAPICELPM